MNNNLPKNSKGIAHLAVLALMGVLVTSAAVIIYVRRNNSGGVDEVREPLNDRDQVVDEDNRDEEQGDEEDRNNDEDGGSYTVYFNDDCIKGDDGSDQPVEIEICLSNAWAQTCDGLYSRWEGTAHNKYAIRTSAGEDVREGDGEFHFTLNKNSPQLSADKKTLTIKHWMECPYCEDSSLEITGTIMQGAKEACN